MCCKNTSSVWKISIGHISCTYVDLSILGSNCFSFLHSDGFHISSGLHEAISLFFLTPVHPTFLHRFGERQSLGIFHRSMNFALLGDGSIDMPQSLHTSYTSFLFLGGEAKNLINVFLLFVIRPSDWKTDGLLQTKHFSSKSGK